MVGQISSSAFRSRDLAYAQCQYLFTIKMVQTILSSLIPKTNKQ